MNKRFAWILFLAVALSISALCFGTHHHSLVVSLWNGSVHGESWKLDTTNNYIVSQKASSEPVVRDYDFTISKITTNIDGVPRRVTAINGKYPGPLIEAYEGDEIRVRVSNKLGGPRSILHFHGMFMDQTNHFDGSPGISQCGIESDSSLEYRFKASPAGTHWYHAHWGTQVIDGLVGPMVIHKRDHIPPADELADQVVLLSDLYNSEGEDLMTVFQEPWIGGTVEPIPDIALAQGSTQPILSIPSNTPVRLRLINSASYSAFNLKLESGSINVVEADGEPTTPTTVDSLLIFPGQRYSITVNLTKSDRLFTVPQINLYEVGEDKTLPFSTENLNASSSQLNVYLNVNDSDNNDATLKPISGLQYDASDLVEPYIPPAAAEIVPRAIREKNVDLTMTRSSEGVISGAINDNIGTYSHSTSILYSMYEDLLNSNLSNAPLKDRHHYHSGSDKGAQSQTGLSTFEQETRKSLYTAHGSEEVIDLIVRNLDDGPHPIHLHGHQMWILERGWISEDGVLDRYMWTSPAPLKRDVILVPKNGWARLRVQLRNPGLWMIHCHIPWHSKIGMMAFISSQFNRIKEILPPQEWFESCSKDSHIYSVLKEGFPRIESQDTSISEDS